MADTKTYVFRDGARLTPAMLYWIEMLDDAFFARFRLHIVVSSGIRTRAEQKAIFLSRYVLASQVNGRKVYDWRYAEGQLYGRISPLGTVAAWDSPQANHVLENTGAGAADLRDTGSDAGIMTKGTVRWQWMRDNIQRFNLSNEGDSFGEPWHKKFLLGPWASVPSGGGDTPFPNPNPPKETQPTMFILKTSATYYLMDGGYSYKLLNTAELVQAQKIVAANRDGSVLEGTQAEFDLRMKILTTGTVASPTVGEIANGVWTKDLQAKNPDATNIPGKTAQAGSMLGNVTADAQWLQENPGSFTPAQIKAITDAIIGGVVEALPPGSDPTVVAAAVLAGIKTLTYTTTVD
jgi:hypothetical protein